MNRGKFASEYTKHINLKKANTDEIKRLVYMAYMAGMKKEREIQKQNYEQSQHMDNL
jgi:hypothetical protein